MAGFELLDGVRSLAPAEWNALVGDESPFLEWEWLASLEESGAACERTGWALTAIIPPELVAPGTIDLAAHPEVAGGLTAMHGLDGISTGTIAGEPFLVGTIELTQVDEGCVSGVLTGFGSGLADPTLGGPELDGGFIAPTC